MQVVFGSSVDQTLDLDNIYQRASDTSFLIYFPLILALIAATYFVIWTLERESEQRRRAREEAAVPVTATSGARARRLYFRTSHE